MCIFDNIYDVYVCECMKKNGKRESDERVIVYISVVHDKMRLF